MIPSNPNSAGAHRENLALIFQEALTAIVRLRSRRQNLTDAESFRHQMKEALMAAALDARNKAGYATEDTRMCTLAVVGFLDESILNASNPIFAQWSGKPLQEELFGTHLAGEAFFQNVELLLARNDSEDLADLLEVHYLCLLLGFAGRYSVAGRGELPAIKAAIADKIRRIRRAPGALSPSWAPTGALMHSSGDPWGRRLLISAIGCLVLALVLFASFKFSLSSGVSDVRAIATRKRG
jgi:type VI secretion system protein ImpK